MHVRIVEKEAFRIVGIQKKVPIIFKGVNPEIAAMWDRLKGGKIDRLKQLSNVEPYGIIQASTNFSEGRMEEKGELDHYIGVATTEECPEDMAQLEVPASTWAVFEAAGPFPDTLQEVWGRIFAEWFPSSNFESVRGCLFLPSIIFPVLRSIQSFPSETFEATHLYTALPFCTIQPCPFKSMLSILRERPVR